jgi:hypothetical protein
MPRLALSLASSLILSLGVTGLSAVASSASRGLPDCRGHPQVRPRQVVLACADGGFGVDHLSWIGWGGARAVGIGSAYANDCAPSCVAGHVRRYPALLILRGSQRCPDGSSAYRTITYAFVGRSPFPPTAPGTLNPRRTVRCGSP